jgi:hypothetical protein
MKITPSSATFTFDTSKAVPDVHRPVGGKNVICHLTEGFDASKSPGDYGKAWTGKGTFRITLAAGETLAKWEFGFLQIMKTNDVSFIYGGREPDDGGVVINVSKTPALTQTIALDSNDLYSPWTIPQPRNTVAGGLVTCKTGDHPSVKAARQLDNKKTGRQNFLYRIIDEREFWTVLTARENIPNPDPDKFQFGFQHQRYFHWKLRYDVKFRWRLDEPQVAISKSVFTPDQTSNPGAPPDASLQALLQAPKPPQANVLLQAAIVTAVNTSGGGNRTDTLKREPFIPDDFYQ